MINKFFKKASEEGFPNACRAAGNYLIDKIDYLPRSITSQIFEYRFGPGVDVMERDWDNLIILDACRYDYFASEIYFEGELEPVISQGAHSWEFMKANFSGRKLHNTVYVTANPHVDKLDDDVFYTVESLLDTWDEELGTVHPNQVVDAAVRAHNEYPNKRLVIHFMQPHRPFLGSTAKKLRERYNIAGYNNFVAHGASTKTNSGTSLYQLAEQGEISTAQVHQAYQETLEIVLEYVEKVIQCLDGKTVITSDHGEMLGERGVLKKRFSHPQDLYNTELREVPWFVIESNNRKHIIPEEPIGFERLDDMIINQRLESLGYAPE